MSAPVTNSNVSRPAPRANTGSALLDRLNDLSRLLMQLERRFDPFVRPAFDAFLRDPLARLTTALINRQRPNEGLSIAEEKPLPDEEAHLALDHLELRRSRCVASGSRAASSAAATPRRTASCAASSSCTTDLPPQLRHGIYAEPRTYRAWVRFSGPGPYVTPDIDDVGFMSISIKLMGVPGPKLMDEEKFTQDMFGVSTPTFVTPDTKANAQLQIESLKNAQIFYFVNLHRPHMLDLIMQGAVDQDAEQPVRGALLQLRAVPARRRPGDAVLGLAEDRRSARRSRGCRCARPTTTCATPWSRRSHAGDVELDIRLQLQTDPHLMPIENNAVLWPERLSPRVSVATLRMPRQKFDSPAQMEFAKRLSYNPWHCDRRASSARAIRAAPGAGCTASCRSCGTR